MLINEPDHDRANKADKHCVDEERNHAKASFALGVGRIECTAVCAMDLDTVHFVLLGMEQDRVALPADIIHGIVIRPKDGRSVQNDAGCRRLDYFEADPTSGHTPILEIKNRPLLPGRPGGVSTSVGPVM
jgi:hypothetical protein